MISIVMCSADPARQEKASRHWREVFAAEPHQLVNIFKPASLTSGYTQGLRESTGDIVIFAHDDVEVLSADFVPRLKAHMTRFDVVGVAGTSRLIGPSWSNAGPPDLFGQVLQQHGTKWILYIYGAPAPVVGGIQAMDGLFLAFRRDVIEKLGWDEQTFAGFHLYDMDVTYRAFLAGYKLAVANDLHLFHASGGNFTGVWQQEAHRFVQKFAGKLALNSPREGFRFAVVELPSKEAARDIMSPPHWAFPELLPETTSPSANS